MRRKSSRGAEGRLDASRLPYAPAEVVLWATGFLRLSLNIRLCHVTFADDAVQAARRVQNRRCTDPAGDYGWAASVQIGQQRNDGSVASFCRGMTVPITCILPWTMTVATDAAPP